MKLHLPDHGLHNSDGSPLYWALNAAQAVLREQALRRVKWSNSTDTQPVEYRTSTQLADQGNRRFTFALDAIHRRFQLISWCTGVI